jgi:hypothetical protein
MRILIIILLLVSLTTAAVLQGSFLHTLIAFGVGVYILVPCALLIGLTGLLSIRWRSLLWWTKRAALVWILMIAALALSWGVGTILHRRAIRSAKQYVNAAAATLDRIKERDGAYPTKLPEELLVHQPSLLLDSYKSDGATFEFVYYDDASLHDSYVFSSVRRNWDSD